VPLSKVIQSVFLYESIYLVFLYELLIE